LLSETLIGRTRQTDDLNSTEVTPRIGLRLHILSNLRNELLKEKQPKPRITDDGATYVLADVEWFWPVDEPDERFASKQRIRTGLGYRRSFAWRFEALYIWNRSRNTIDESFSTSDNIP